MGKSSSSNKTETKSTTNNQQTTVGQEVSDNGVAINGEGNSVTITNTDHGMVDKGVTAFMEAVGLTRESLHGMSEVSQQAIFENSEARDASLSFGRDAMQESFMFAESLATESGLNALDSQRMNNELAQDMAGLATDAVLDSASMATDTARDAMLSVENTVDNALQTNESLAAGFGEKLQLLTEQSMNNQSQTISDALMTVTDNNVAALDVVDANNERTTQLLSDAASMTAQTFNQMAERQERGLESALTVANNVAMDDTAEQNQNIGKYFALAAGAIGVAMALRK
jgi:hypothetical protein